MIKYIKFYFTRGEPLTLPEDKALKIIESNDTLIKITDEKGEWTGETIHKAHIVQTVRDREMEKEKEHEERLKNPRLAEAAFENKFDLNKMRPRFVDDALEE